LALSIHKLKFLAVGIRKSSLIGSWIPKTALLGPWSRKNTLLGSWNSRYHRSKALGQQKPTLWLSTPQKTVDGSQTSNSESKALQILKNAFWLL
jgi:hypothetical protein